MRYIYTVEYHSPLKRKAIGSFAEMWKALDTVIQTEVSQKEKNKYRMYITHICGIQKTGIKDPICKAEMETQMQKTNVLTFLCFERRKLSTICPRSTQNSSSMKQCLNSCPSYPSSLRRNVFLTCREERVLNPDFKFKALHLLTGKCWASRSKILLERSQALSFAFKN